MIKQNDIEIIKGKIILYGRLINNRDVFEASRLLDNIIQCIEQVCQDKEEKLYIGYDDWYIEYTKGDGY